ncbi:arylsulfatase F-like [Ptychodera flava]|uniref:arylsulfatase F-like n=1 Tax=Ptychodera flava TaxID=63121 RepID=UPI00396AA058
MLTTLQILILLIVSTLATSNVKPNFVIFLADDLGIGDIGCFGNDTIHTPAIDSLAKEGAKLTHNLVAAPTCSPSRAALLTGRYPIRSGMASALQQGVVSMITSTDCKAGLPRNETTFAELLKAAGYATAIIGKWHLGTNLDSSSDHYFYPVNQGFDYFYGMPTTLINECGPDGRYIAWFIQKRLIMGCCLWSLAYAVVLVVLHVLGVLGRRGVIIIGFHIVLWLGWNYASHTLLFRQFMCVLVKNHDVIEQPVVLDTISTRMVNQANSFIERSATQGPFLLYFPFLQTHTALFNMKNFTGSSKHGKYGDNVEEMDWMVGKVLSKLSELGLVESTFIYFTSDHGGALKEVSVLPPRVGEREGGWNGIYKGGKGQNWEGGIRVPTVVRYPPMIPGGIEISVPTSTMDVFPTIASLAGVDLPSDRVIDGRDLAPLLRGTTTALPHDYLFHYCGQWLNAVTFTSQKDNAIYKLHYVTPNIPAGETDCNITMYCPCTGDETTRHDPPLVFDLRRDPAEQRPLPATNDQIRNIISRVDEAISQHRRSIVPVAHQITKETLAGSFWRQPCCNFPFCWCQEDEST